MVLQQGGVQDIYSFQIGMKPQILNLTSVLGHFADQMARIQPLVGQLEASPDIHTMVGLLQDGLQENQGQDLASEDWIAVLDRVGQATVATSHEYPVAISWEEVLLRGSALDISTRRVLVVHVAVRVRRAGEVGDLGEGLPRVCRRLRFF